MQSDLFRENEERSSVDSLSEIDKKRDMLSNINIKNKHIKKLFHEIKVYIISIDNQALYSVKFFAAIKKEAQRTK